MKGFKLDITYKLLSPKEADLAVHGQEYVDDMGPNYYEEDYWLRALVRCEDGKPVEILGEDGGEPEDQSFRRDWAWVPQALQDAYDLGYGHGYLKGLNESVNATEHRAVD
jgi:hypothetical protein